MLRNEELEIEIDATGQVQVHVRGAGGRRCLEYLDVFRAFLGPVQEQHLTPEYYQADTGVAAGRTQHAGTVDTRRVP